MNLLEIDYMTGFPVQGWLIIAAAIMLALLGAVGIYNVWFRPPGTPTTPFRTSCCAARAYRKDERTYVCSKCGQDATFEYMEWLDELNERHFNG